MSDKYWIDTLNRYSRPCQLSPCATAGIKAGDRITAIDNNAINNITDLRLALWDKQPGDTISIVIVRKRLLLFEKNLGYTLTLK